MLRFVRTLRQFKDILDSTPDMDSIRSPTLLPLEIYHMIIDFVKGKFSVAFSVFIYNTITDDYPMTMI